MKLVTTGSSSARASSATLSSIPWRRISTPTTRTGDRASPSTASTSSAQAATTSASTGEGAAGPTGSHSSSTMSRGSSM